MWNDLRTAFTFLTIIPMGKIETERKPGWSFVWYPMVGLVIGGALVLTAHFSPFTAQTTTFFVLLAWVVLTGGLHLDGFSDSCDGLVATVPPERRLEIMKDPRTGSWAVIGLILLLLGKWTAIPALSPSPLLLILPPVMGRWVMVIAVYRFPYARSSGLGGYFRDGLEGAQVLASTGLALAIVVIVTRQIAPVLIVFTIGALTVSLFGHWAARRLGGGITGDVYGALCELTELFCLLGLSLWVSG